MLRWLLGICAVGLAAAILVSAGLYYYITDDLPRIETLADYRPPVITTFYADDNRKIGEFYKERRIITPFDRIPETLVNAFVAAEDARFFKHQGVDLLSILRAFVKNLEAGTIVQGGSTITQQVAKSFFLTPEKSYRRKLKEAILAHRIERSFTKDEILFLYLNQIYLGHGAYGVAAAAENYFGKSVGDLNLAECAVLAGLPQAPSRYSPFKNPPGARERQIYVLGRMAAEGHITEDQVVQAVRTELDIQPRRNWYIEKVPFYAEHVRRYIEQTYGADMLYREGLQVYTAVNIEMQKIARKEVEKGLTALDMRQGYRGPLSRLSPSETTAFIERLQQSPAPGAVVKGVVVRVDDASETVRVEFGAGAGIIAMEDMRWARKPDPEVAYYEDRLYRPSDALDKGDVILVRIKDKPGADGIWPLALAQEPLAQAALMCQSAETGEIKAMIGGRDFRESQFNRAVQSRRQPGSAFKPIIYAAALDKGYTAATVIIDAPIVFQDKDQEETWKPKNYKEKFFGPTLLREALVKSRNVVTIKILMDIGVPYAIRYAQKLGIESELSPDLSIALGSSGVSLLELVSAYAVFANSGERIEPLFIRKIVDRDGHVLETAQPRRRRVIEKSTAYIMTHLMEGVVKHGTGWRVRALKRPVAGKTGTTNNLHDAWFVGYTPRYVTGVWVGFDQEASLGKGETGSRAASPIWLGFMKRILADTPAAVFPVPEGVIFSKIDAETGLLPIPTSRKTVFECFKEGTVPTAHTPKPDVVAEDDFFKTGF